MKIKIFRKVFEADGNIIYFPQSKKNGKSKIELIMGFNFMFFSFEQKLGKKSLEFHENLNIN
jgi:hypothetical protein